MTSVTSRGTRRRVSTFVSATALLVGAAAVSGAHAPAQPPGTLCLWAGASYTPNDSLAAGGRTFTCTIDPHGVPRWVHGQVTGRASTVPNPGASGNPVGRFSLGAWQPGTPYNDYCVGDQLIEGTDDIFEVFDASGFILWKSAGPIEHWSFAGDPAPARTWRTSSLCRDGELT